MWQPDPAWHPLPGGMGTSTLGLWRAVIGDQPVVVKRLVPPTDDDPPELADPRHFAYWRRPADAATSGSLDTSPGLRGPRTEVSEDAEGVTLVQDWVEGAANSGLFCAHALGRFAGAELGDATWLAAGQLRSRLERVARRGGWPTLARTT